MSVIFWFSGTGNSFFAAKRAAAELGDIPLVSMAAGSPGEAVGGSGEKVGFVFPSYYGNLPRIVRSFVETLKVKPETYLFAIVTMGGVGQGSIAALRSAFRGKNLQLDYGRGILMPANYVLAYNPADPNKCAAKLHKADERLRRACAEIAAGTRSVRAFKFTAKKLYKNIPSLDAKFSTEDSCTACGLCAQICPVGNIRTLDGKPSWAHHCEHCAACISWCPVQAIQYGSRTKTRRRYHNPEVYVNDLLPKPPSDSKTFS